MANSKTGSSMSTQSGFKVTSGAVREDYSFEWKIENFLVLKSSKDLLDELEFQFVTGSGSSHGFPLTWCCFLKESESEFKNIDVFLNLTKSPKGCKTVPVKYSFMLLKPNREIYSYGIGKLRQFTVEETSYGFADLIPSDEEELKDLLWEDGSMVIKLTVELYLLKPTPVVETNKVDLQVEINLFEKQELQKLSDFVTRIIESDSQPEAGKIIKVVSKDDKEFYANTALLSARSPVFQAMFNSENWKEGQGSSGEAKLVLEDLSGKTVKVLLHYLMCGVLLKEDWKDEDVLLELTWAVQKYQLDDLTQFLDKVLPALHYNGTEVLAKLALLASRLGMKNSEEKLLSKLKETATTIDELILDKEGSLIEKD